MADVDEIARLARAVWGDELGQCIVGRQSVHVFAVTGDRMLLRIEHAHAVAAAKTALVQLGTGGQVVGLMVDRSAAETAAELMQTQAQEPPIVPTEGG